MKESILFRKLFIPIYNPSRYAPCINHRTTFNLKEASLHKENIDAGKKSKEKMNRKEKKVRNVKII